MGAISPPVAAGEPTNRGWGAGCGNLPLPGRLFAIMSAVLRIDLGQPLPFRRTPEFLFGDARRRIRRLGGVAGAILALAVVAVWWATASHNLQPDTGALAPADTGADRVAVPRSMAPAEPFPLIAEPQARAVPREREGPTLPPAAPHEEIAPTAPAPEAITAPIVQPRREAPLRSLPLVTGEPSPAVAPAEPAPAPASPATAAVPGDVAPADLPPTAGKAGSAAPPERHYLQFGTYRLEESVTTVQRHYQMLGMSTIIQREGDYYVLRLLPFPTREEAEQEQARLHDLGIDTLYIPPPAPQP